MTMIYWRAMTRLRPTIDLMNYRCWIGLMLSLMIGYLTMFRLRTIGSTMPNWMIRSLMMTMANCWSLMRDCLSSNRSSSCCSGMNRSSSYYSAMSRSMNCC